MTFVVMVRDECGDDFRAYGSYNLERKYHYPTLDWDNDIEVEAFYAWETAIVAKLQEEWEAKFGEECSVFLEEENQYYYN